MMNHRIYRLSLLLITIFASVESEAQSVTYNHDATKMNQFMMQETGSGSFQTESEFLLYDLFHSSYKKTITSTNKQLYRTATYEGSYQQVSYADSIKSRLESRAKVEAVNIADRQVDVAWITEQSKIEKALETYKNNLSRLSACGADTEEKEDWQYYASIFDFEIDRTRDAYMANSERQKEFLNIYNDITKRNSKLVGRLRYLKALKASQEVLASTNRRDRRLNKIVTASYNNWRDNIATAIVR